MNRGLAFVSKQKTPLEIGMELGRRGDKAGLTREIINLITRNPRAAPEEKQMRDLVKGFILANNRDNGPKAVDAVLDSLKASIRALANKSSTYDGRVLLMEDAMERREREVAREVQKRMGLTDDVLIREEARYEKEVVKVLATDTAYQKYKARFKKYDQIAEQLDNAMDKLAQAAERIGEIKKSAIPSATLLIADVERVIKSEFQRSNLKKVGWLSVAIVGLAAAAVVAKHMFEDEEIPRKIKK